MTIHPIPPVYDKNSKILILGSFPSVRSRETGFFYGHPGNRFWRVMAEVLDDTLPETIEEKRVLLLKHHIALWDVIRSCDIEGSSDSSIRNVIPNDMEQIFDTAKINAIFVNGRTAEKYYKKYIDPDPARPVYCLPSTSPANAAWSLERLAGEWKSVRRFLQEG